MAIRDDKGRFVSSNPNAPKKKKPEIEAKLVPVNKILTDEEKKEIEELVIAKDMHKIAAWIVARSVTIDDVHKYLKEYATFISPKLSSVEQKTETKTTFTFKIEGIGNIFQEKKPEVETKELKTIEGELENDN